LLRNQPAAARNNILRAEAGLAYNFLWPAWEAAWLLRLELHETW